MKLSEFQQDSGAQKKALKVGGAVLAILWLASHFSHHTPQVRPVMAGTKPIPVVASPVPVVPVAVVAPVVVAPPAAPPDPMANVARTFTGTWLGRATVSQAPDGRACDVGIEIKRQDKDKDAPPFDAFVNLNCVFQKGRLPHREDASFVLSGEGHDGVVPFIALNAVSNIGVAESEFHCAIRSMRISNFGDLGRVSASWKEEGTERCQGGEVVLQRRRWF